MKIERLRGKIHLFFPESGVWSPESGVQDLSWTSKSSCVRSPESKIYLGRLIVLSPKSGVQDLSCPSIYSLLAFLKLFL
jgi:hypothetical protein